MILIWQLDGVCLLILIKSALLFSDAIYNLDLLVVSDIFDRILWQILDYPYKFANIRKNIGNFYSLSTWQHLSMRAEI